jgi:hypothetical protein
MDSNVLNVGKTIAMAVRHISLVRYAEGHTAVIALMDSNVLNVGETIAMDARHLSLVICANGHTAVIALVKSHVLNVGETIAMSIGAVGHWSLVRHANGKHVPTVHGLRAMYVNALNVKTAAFQFAVNVAISITVWTAGKVARLWMESIGAAAVRKNQRAIILNNKFPL